MMLLEMMCKPSRVSEERFCGEDATCNMCAPQAAAREAGAVDHAVINKQITDQYRREKLERERALFAQRTKNPRSRQFLFVLATCKESCT